MALSHKDNPIAAPEVKEESMREPGRCRKSTENGKVGSAIGPSGSREAASNSPIGDNHSQKGYSLFSIKSTLRNVQPTIRPHGCTL